MRTRIGFPILAAAAVATVLVLVTCTPTSVPVRVYSKGVIAAKGSIFVNGVEYDTTSATITVNDLAATEVDLRVGMLVDFKGEVDTSSGTGTASGIGSYFGFEGPICAIAGSTLVVPAAGTKVEVKGTRDAATSKLSASVIETT